MVNDCWNPVAVALLVPHWCDDDNPACVDHNLLYIHESLYILTNYTFIMYTSPDTFEL